MNNSSVRYDLDVSDSNRSNVCVLLPRPRARSWSISGRAGRSGLTDCFGAAIKTISSSTVKVKEDPPVMAADC